MVSLKKQMPATIHDCAEVVNEKFKLGLNMTEIRKGGDFDKNTFCEFITVGMDIFSERLSYKTKDKTKFERKKNKIDTPIRKTKPKTVNNMSRSTSGNILDFYVCPISHELPVNPVVAEDGYIYERECIEQHFMRSDKSPMFNIAVGRTLLPARSVHHTLQELLGAGVCDERLDEWMRKPQSKQCIKFIDTPHGGAVAKIYENGELVRTEFTEGHPLHGEVMHNGHACTKRHP